MIKFDKFLFKIGGKILQKKFFKSSLTIILILYFKVIKVDRLFFQIE